MSELKLNFGYGVRNNCTLSGMSPPISVRSTPTSWLSVGAYTVFMHCKDMGFSLLTTGDGGLARKNCLSANIGPVGCTWILLRVSFSKKKRIHYLNVCSAPVEWGRNTWTAFPLFLMGKLFGSIPLFWNDVYLTLKRSFNELYSLKWCSFQNFPGKKKVPIERTWSM